MVTVDPSDDTIDRWIVQHYRYDLTRRERRTVDETAFDNQAEFEAYLTTALDRLKAAIGAGDAEPVERYSGVHKAAGHADRERCRRARIPDEQA
jgi:hypothetical protein